VGHKIAGALPDVAGLVNALGLSSIHMKILADIDRSGLPATDWEGP
jgi:hypothetical protein